MDVQPAPVKSEEKKLEPQIASPQAAGESAAEDLSQDKDNTISFWQHPFVQNVLPFLTSLVLHAGLVVMGIVGYKAATTIVAVVKEQIIIPDAAIVENGDVGAPPQPKLRTESGSTNDKFTDVPAETQQVEKKNNALASALMSSNDSEAGEGLIGVGGDTGIASKSGGLRSQRKGDAAAAPTPFGAVKSTSGSSPFMGIRGNAMRVAYVCDASGSMLPKKDRLILEIQKAIGILKPIQQFNVIFFHGETAQDLCRLLTPATPANKQKVSSALPEVEFASKTGTTDPIAALRLAFDQQPQLIYLLTDGDFNGPGGNEAVIRYIVERNRDRKVKINTILFLGSQSEAETTKSFREVMKQIADENGGKFRVVFVDDETE